MDRDTDTSFCVRLSATESRQMDLTQIEALNAQRLTQKLPPLKKIKRSSGLTEYVTAEALEALEQDKQRRRNQRKLAKLTDKTTPPNLFQRLFTRKAKKDR